MKKIIFLFAVVFFLSACVGKTKNVDALADDTELISDTLTHHATLLNIVDRGTYVSVDIADPWNQGQALARYALVHRDSVLPENLPDEVRLLRVPIRKAAVYSAVHTSIMKELGVLDALVAVAEGHFFTEKDTIKSLLTSGKILDVGAATSPSMERIAASEAELIFLSPMQGVSGANVAIEKYPVEEMLCADYMECSPIGRAEWILLFGELFGKREDATAIFSDVIDKYSNLQYKVAGSKLPNPKVMTETEYTGIWYLPAGGSYMARMIKDAGGDYLWADVEGTGSIQADVAQVLARASDADIWLIRTFGYDISPESLRAINPLNVNFKPYKQGGVYGCNTEDRPLFNDLAFHPERVLADYVAIMHPDVAEDYELRYFKKM